MGPVPMIGAGIMEARFACNYTGGIIGRGGGRERDERPEPRATSRCVREGLIFYDVNDNVT